MKRITVILAMIVASGCCSKSLPQASVSKEQNNELQVLHYTEKLRDTVICVTLPAEWRERESTCDSSYLETSAAYSEARIDSCGKLIHTLHNKPLSAPVTLTVKDTSESAGRTTVEYRTETIERLVERPLTWLQKTLIYCGIMFLISASIRIAISALRRKKLI